MSVPDATTSTGQTNTGTTTTAPVALTYMFQGVAGLVPRDEPQLVSSRYDETVSVWSTKTGITDAFVVLRDSSAPTSRSAEGDMSTAPLEVPSGEAWLVTDKDVGEPPPASATRVMWWRPDGRLWVVSNVGISSVHLVELTLQIQAGSGVSFVLPDPGMTFVGTTRLARLRSVQQEWTLDGSNIGLAVTNGGLAAQIGSNPVEYITERIVDGMPGYVLTLANGQLNVIWPTDDPDRWGSLFISSLLVPRADEIVSALVAR